MASPEAKIDKTIVLVTGASSGIGLETVQALAVLSPSMHILLGSRSLEKGQTALTSIQTALGPSQKATITVLPLEVTSLDSIRAAVTHITTHHNKLDILINNAGILHIDTDPDMTLEQTLLLLRTTFETNTFGPTVLTSALVPLLKLSPSPQIIHVTSEQGSITLKLDPSYKWARLPGDAYRMSKAALNMLAACQRVRFEEWGCRVYAYTPGFCVTNLTGEEGRKVRIANGARPAAEAAEGVVRIVSGEKGEGIGMGGMLDVDGGLMPW